MAVIHSIVFIGAIALLFMARQENSGVARLVAALGLDFWDFCYFVVAVLMFYVVIVGAVVTLIAINENLMSIREDISVSASIRQQDINSLQQEIVRIRRKMGGDSPDLLEREAARRRLSEQGFTNLGEAQDSSPHEPSVMPSDNNSGGKAPTEEQDESEESESRELVKKFAIAFLALVGGLAVWGFFTRTERASKVEAAEIRSEDSSSLEDYLRQSVGKYPRTVGFFQNKEIRTRLTSLLGENSYLLRRDWRVENKISKTDITSELFTTIVCDERICANRMEIAYSVNGKSFTVAWFEDDQLRGVVAE
jgi:hypothetical protein